MDSFMALGRIPYVLETERLVLRAYDPRDHTQAATLFAAIDESRAHLVPYMSWPDHHRRLEDTAAWMRTSRARFESMTDFAYGVYARDDGRFVGGAGMHVRGEPLPVAIEIGYWLRTSETGRGYAREMTRGLARLLLEHVGAERIVIRAEVDNARSRRVPEALGFVFEGIARRGIRIREKGRDLAIYSLLPEEAASLA
jgi:RimJ/RimL family protein N-acetyltransferase